MNTTTEQLLTDLVQEKGITKIIIDMKYRIEFDIRMINICKDINNIEYNISIRDIQHGIIITSHRQYSKMDSVCEYEKYEDDTSCISIISGLTNENWFRSFNDNYLKYRPDLKEFDLLDDEFTVWCDTNGVENNGEQWITFLEYDGEEITEVNNENYSRFMRDYS